MKKAFILIPPFVVILVILIIQFLPMMNLKTKNMISKDYGHFIFYYEKKDAKAIPDLARTLEINYKRINEDLGFTSNYKVKVYVYPDLNTFHQKKYGMLGKFIGPEWYVGDNIKDKVLVVSPLNPGKQHSYNTILGVVVHEYVHSIVFQINKNTPKWLNEGLAGYLSDNAKPWSGWSINDQKIPSINDMKTENPIIFGNNGYYQFSYTYIKFLDENYGLKKLATLIRKPRAYHEIFGLIESQIYQRWVKYLEKNYR